MAVEVTLFRYHNNESYKKPNDPNAYVPSTTTVTVNNTTNEVTVIQEVDPYVPRANTGIELEIGDTTIEYQNPFPDGRIVVLWVYTYTDEGYQVGHRIVSESETGFVINVPIACNLKYIATVTS